MKLFHGNLYHLTNGTICMYLCDTNLKSTICVVPVAPNDGLSTVFNIPGLNDVLYPEKAKEISKILVSRPVYLKGKIVTVDYQSYLEVSEIVLHKLLKKTNATYQSLSHARFSDMQNKNYILTEDYYKFLTWFDYKTKLQYQFSLNNTPDLVLNSIVWVELGNNIGSELQKMRPAILFRKIFSNNDPNASSAIIIPITSKASAAKYVKSNYPININGKINYAKINDMQRVSIKRIKYPFKDSENNIVVVCDKDISEIKKMIISYYRLDS